MIDADNKGEMNIDNLPLVRIHVWQHPFKRVLYTVYNENKHYQ